MINAVKSWFLNYVLLEAAGTGSGAQYWWLLPGDHHYNPSPEKLG